MSRLLLGLALLPSSASVLAAAARCFGPLLGHGPRSAWFLGGLAAYPVLHLFALRPTRVYVVGHELTHAFAAVLSGAQVKKFQVGTEGGHVEVTAVNPFIALAPYCVPFYTLLWIAAYKVWGLLGGAGRHDAVFAAGMGLTLSFHLWYTVSTLVGAKQPDLEKAGGVVFSLALIALANGLLVALTLRGLFPAAVSLRAFARGSWTGTASFWLFARDAARAAWEAVRAGPARPA